jgi:hypothetical protein
MAVSEAEMVSGLLQDNGYHPISVHAPGRVPKLMLIWMKDDAREETEMLARGLAKLAQVQRVRVCYRDRGQVLISAQLMPEALREDGTADGR